MLPGTVPCREPPQFLPASTQQSAEAIHCLQKQSLPAGSWSGRRGSQQCPDEVGHEEDDDDEVEIEELGQVLGQTAGD